MPDLLRILIVDQNAERAAILEDGLREAGYRNVMVVREVHNLLRRIVGINPDVIFIDLEDPNRDVLEQMFQVSRSVPRPVAMFVDQSDTATIEQAIDAGVATYIVDALRTGQIDGFCAGEPWNSLAVDHAVGCIVTSTEEIWHHSPEKVLGMRADWADAHPRETAALVRALRSAAYWCDRPDSHAELAALLAQPRYVGESAETLLRGMTGHMLLAAGTLPKPVADFLIYAHHGATVPEPRHARWFYRQMVRWGQVAASEVAATAAQSTYRPDLYRAGVAGTAFGITADDEIALDYSSW